MATIFRGTARNDSLLGTTADDTFMPSGGNDRVWGGLSGFDTLELTGAATDYAARLNADGTITILDMRQSSPDGTITFRDVDEIGFIDQRATGSQVLTMLPKLLIGAAGADKSLGSSANDVITASTGNDSIWGGTGGEDTLILTGNIADYKFTANSNGSYTLQDLRAGGPDGIDTIRSIEVFNFADGQKSLAQLVALNQVAAVNIVKGTAGADNLLGTTGNDVMTGGAGHDRVWGGKGGNDTAVYSGKFADYIISDNHNGSFTLVDTRSGANDGTDVVRGIETFRFADKSVAVSDILTGNRATYTNIIGTAGSDTLTGADTSGIFGGHTNDVIIGLGGNDIIRAGAGNDVVAGDRLPGLIGDGPAISGTKPEADISLKDMIVTQSQRATVTFLGETAGYQNTFGIYQIAADGTIHDVKVLFANASLAGSGGSLIAGQSAVTVDLVAGDRIGFFVLSNAYAQSGMASLLGRTDGTFKFVNSAGSVGNVSDVASLKLVHVDTQGVVSTVRSAYGTTAFHTIAGSTGLLNADGIEHVKASYKLSDGSIKLGFEDLWGGGDRDYDDTVFSFKVETIETLASSRAASGEDGADTLLGGTGNDTLYGGGGNDFLDGGLNSDILNGGSGIDMADYSRADAYVVADLAATGSVGEANGDSYISIEGLIGSRYSDRLLGDSGNNEIAGRAGNDFLDGRDGNDVLRGETGADTLIGGQGFDTATYMTSASGVTVDLMAGTGLGGDAAGDTLSGIEAVQGSNTGADWLSGSGSDDHLSGFGGDDKLDGRGGADLLSGGQGSDTLAGSDGNDGLYGQDGDDDLSGGDGADVVAGGLGRDTLSGGAGTDTFVFCASDTGDVILDFDISADRIDLRGVAGNITLGMVSITAIDDGDVLIQVGSGSAATGFHVLGVAASTLSASNFVF